MTTPAFAVMLLPPGGRPGVDFPMLPREANPAHTSVQFLVSRTWRDESLMAFRPEHLTLSPSPPGVGPEHHTDPTNRPPLVTVMSSKRKCCVSGQCDSFSWGLQHQADCIFSAPVKQAPCSSAPLPSLLSPSAHGLRVEDSQVAESWFHGLALSPVFSASINTHFESVFSVNTFVVSVLIEL